MSQIKKFNKDKRRGIVKLSKSQDSDGSRLSTPEGREKNQNRQKRIMAIKMNLIKDLHSSNNVTKGNLNIKVSQADGSSTGRSYDKPLK